jgi:hypothetical protein
MQSSLERFLSRALEYSSHPPVSVYGTGYQGNTRRLFSAVSLVMRFGRSLSSAFNCLVTFLSASSCALITPGKHRNINLFGIDYALRPRLSSRLTLGGRTLPRKPWVYGDQNSHLVYRYSCLHSHSGTLHRPLRSGFSASTTLSYHCGGTYPTAIRSFGILFIANHFRRDIAR